MVKNLQCLKTPQIRMYVNDYLRHAKHHAKTALLSGLDHDTPFLNNPLSTVN